ncbi:MULTISPECIES: Na+/H+ antiporter subunit G [Halomonas]|uniref:Na(+)/H(+) antiporter subunit G n=1 Tax=Halomonas chromatireducens TaxID=507626 RepID=A0A109ULY9_9GAMM|nr:MULTISPECIES: Na+/H+ antiporter subunit G [Halomonas]AMD01282.1 Na(+)/H(+) antiporter subunit G [Halomonas chromatireducens]MBZ0329927.1 Na+/H+ antiporter subunit G [Halomonas sp. ANAO-440]
MTFYVIAEGVIAFLLVAGGVFAFTGSLGMLQFKDFFMRLHGPTKGTTLGIGCILIASMLYFTITQRELHVQELLITLFLFITAPVTGHMLAKTGLHMHLRFITGTRGSVPEFRDEDVGQSRVARPARAKHPWKYRKAKRTRMRR